jgi:hypothetical protein
MSKTTAYCGLAMVVLLALTAVPFTPYDALAQTAMPRGLLTDCREAATPQTMEMMDSVRAIVAQQDQLLQALEALADKQRRRISSPNAPDEVKREYERLEGQISAVYQTRVEYASFFNNLCRGGLLLP